MADPRVFQTQANSEFWGSGLDALRRAVTKIPEIIPQLPQMAWNAVRSPADWVLGGSPVEQQLRMQEYRPSIKLRDLYSKGFEDLTLPSATALEGRPGDAYRAGTPEARAYAMSEALNPLAAVLGNPATYLRAAKIPGQVAMDVARANVPVGVKAQGPTFLDELLQYAQRKFGALDLSQLSFKELRALAKEPIQGTTVVHGNAGPLDLSRVSAENPLFVARKPAHGMFYADSAAQRDGEAPLLHVFDAPEYRSWPVMPEGLIADLDMGMNPFLEDELRAADRRVLRAGAAKGKVGDAMLMAPNKPAPLSEWDIGDHSMPQGVVLQEGQLRRRAQGGLVAL